ncbi:glycosyltransferase family 4 protein [Gelidibacter maritimus]|uniref:Glycosyltransferase family 4 protein n=1 Tax=Gelidibacter maritimus TaxID=2761487 RepID=A0A7W2M4S8_9FLAO|nr:glycosyltransferase family 4 protein [Gelidibacter maritimus]MBA6152673.1 glycosyltransferase family 4 protein [Gelidibacter maritimus]
MKNVLYVGNHLQNSQTNLSYSAVLGPLLEQSGYEVRYTSNKTNKVLRLWDMLWTTFISRTKTDLVLIDTYSTQNFYYAVLVSQLCRLLKLPYIPILHGGNLPNRLENSPKLSKRLFKNAYANVSPSLYLKERFEKAGYQNVVFIPNTISLENYLQHVKTYDTPRLLWVRSFSEIYNPTLAVMVLHELRQRGYDATLCMVGPDSDGSLAEVKALAERLSVSVMFTGKLTKAEWIALSVDYNVFINTTNFDNMPVSVIEAMALGLPVVSTNVGGMPYLIEDGLDGLLVAPSDKMTMADAICTAFEDVDRTEAMVVKARYKVESFDWSRVKGLWEAMLGSDEL